MRRKLSPFVFLLQMEPWKMAVIAALGVGIIGFGMFANSNANIGLLNTNTAAETQNNAQPTPAYPAVFAKYAGGTLPAWPTVKKWANTKAPADLSSLKGKPVLLEVFRIECSHCQDAAPFIALLHGRYAPRGVAFVGIQSPGDVSDPSNPENNWATVQQWIKAQGYTWPVGFDANSAWFQGKFGKKVSYPSLFLIGKDGKIDLIQSGHDQQKALQLAVELERVAPSAGDTKAQAADLSRFLLSNSGGQAPSNDPEAAKMQQSLEADIANRLKQEA